jgi:very-short-patch-repair endonuclease
MEKSHYNFYNTKLKDYARELRSQNATKGERFLWKAVLSKNQTGVRFLRQRPVLHFIVDFFAPGLGLIIEIHGTSHSNKGEEDYQREMTLKNLGFTILRFSEGAVLNNLAALENEIRNVIYSLEAE